MRGLKKNRMGRGQHGNTHADGHRDSMKESAKGRFFENPYFVLFNVCGSRMFIETINVTITDTIEDKNNLEFHEIYNYIYNPSYNRWYAAKYLLSPVQSPEQMTVKLVFCNIVPTSDCLED